MIIFKNVKHKYNIFIYFYFLILKMGTNLIVPVKKKIRVAELSKDTIPEFFFLESILLASLPKPSQGT